MNHLVHFPILAMVICALLAGCAVPRQAPSAMKSDEQLAREIVDCMLENDPDSRLVIIAMGGKDAMAEYVRQVGTQRELAAERDRYCSPAYSPTPIPTNPNPWLRPAYSDPTVPSNSTVPIVPPTVATDTITATIPPKPSPTPYPRPTPPAWATNYLSFPYDASSTINNRQVPQNQPNCSGGSKPITRWSRTLTTSTPDTFLLDADGHLIQLTQLNFALRHPGRGYLQSDCPDNQFTAEAVFQVPGAPYEPNLIGYVAEWHDSDGNLIGSDQAHDGVSLTLRPDQKPQDVYDRPAVFTIYDSLSPTRQPHPTPQRKGGPFTLTLHTDPTAWPPENRGTQFYGPQSWREATRQSPDLTTKNHYVFDASGNLWTLSKIYVTERTYYYGGSNQVEYIIRLTNDSRAVADFTGYGVSITTTDGMTNSSHWDPIKDRHPLESAQFKITIPTDPPGAITLSIEDFHRQ